ncbi:hypothetical protein MMC30_007591 [Trapelia coarctata]|nr:hypothetical protein [Trapelia coarctata]
MTAYFNLQHPLQGFHPGEYPYRLDVMKHELSCILRGYPPWFQNSLRLANGKFIQHPIRNAGDIARGGWIVAVGLSPTLLIAYHFMSRDGEFEKAAKTKRTTLAQAFRRLLRCLQKVARAIPEERLIWRAHDIIGWTSWKLIEGSNSANLLHKFNSGEVQEFDRIYAQKHWAQDCNKDYARSLTKEQCELFTEALNHYSHNNELSGREISSLKPMISLALRAVLTGSYQVLRYFQEHERIGSQYSQYSQFSKSVLDVPEPCSSKFIYLRDRREDDGD